MNNTYLYHHGIKGQHWGIRRFQNEDGSLTSAGRKRYYPSNIEGAQKDFDNAKTEYKKAANNYNAKKLNWAKEDLKDEKIKSKLNSETKVSKRRATLEEEYKKKGMTEEEAAVAAYKREKTEKILAVTLGLTVTAAAAYGAYKYHDYAFDKVIPSGTSLQNISGFANRGVQDAFYAAVNENDKTRYKGWYADKKMKETGEAHLSNFIATQNAKIASDKNATKILGSLLNNNSSFRSDVEQVLKIKSMYHPYNSKLYSKALSDVKKGKITNTVYQAVNTGLVGRDPSSTNIKNTFYNELSKNGYAGIMDTNDRRKSIFKLANGYNTKSPMILFGGSNYFKTNGSRQMLPNEIKENILKTNKAYKQEANIVKISQSAGAAALGAAGFGAGRYVAQKNNDKIVAKYRKEHPETKLSYKEIIRMYQSK